MTLISPWYFCLYCREHTHVNLPNQRVSSFKDNLKIRAIINKSSPSMATQPRQMGNFWRVLVLETNDEARQALSSAIVSLPNIFLVLLSSAIFSHLFILII